MSMTLLQFAAEGLGGDDVTRGIAVQLNKSSQLLPLLRVQVMKGLIHKFAREESGGGITRRSINMPFPETARGVVTPAQERIEIAGAHIQTDHRLVKANGDARSNEIARRTRTVGRYIDRQLIKGEGATDGTQIIGLQDRITEDSQLHEAAENGAELTLAMFEMLIDSVEDQGAGRFVYAPRALCRKIKRLIMASAGGATVQEAASEIFVYEGVQIVPAGKDHEGTEILAFDETQGNNDETASMYCVAPGPEDDAGTNILMASNSIELIEEGVRESFYHDQLEVAFGLSVFHRKAAARLKGIAKTSEAAE